MKYDVLVVGAGLVGCCIAEVLANKYSKKVLLIEKKDVVGGACATETDPIINLSYQRYGTRIFYTNNDRNWEYLNKFSIFQKAYPRMFINYNRNLYPFPINLNSLNKFFNREFNTLEAKKFITKVTLKYKKENYKNVEEYALSVLGEDLYFSLIKGFIEKHWCQNAKDIRYDKFNSFLKISFDQRNTYFDKFKYVGVPDGGYSNIFIRMLNHKNICLNTSCSYEEYKINYKREIPIIVYTGAIDEFFIYEHGFLDRGYIKYKTKIYRDHKHQNEPLVIYPDRKTLFSRVHEEKCLLSKEIINEYMGTVVQYEYHSKSIENEDLSFFIDSESNKRLLKLYIKKAAKLANIYFLGRLSVPYLNIDQSIDAAFNLCKKIAL